MVSDSGKQYLWISVPSTRTARGLQRDPSSRSAAHVRAAHGDAASGNCEGAQISPGPLVQRHWAVPSPALGDDKVASSRLASRGVEGL